MRKMSSGNNSSKLSVVNEKEKKEKKEKGPQAAYMRSFRYQPKGDMNNILKCNLENCLLCKRGLPSFFEGNSPTW